MTCASSRGTCRSLAHDCQAYAGQLDEVHSAIEHELVELLAWTVGIEVGGTLLAFVTAGAGEVAAQGAEASRIAATAARNATLIERLIAFGRAAAETIGNAAYRATGVSLSLRPLLSSRALVSMADSAEALPTVRGADMAASGGRLAQAAEANVGPRIAVDDAQFGMKVAKHARDFVETRPMFTIDSGSAIGSSRFARDRTRYARAHGIQTGGGGERYWFFRQGADIVVTRDDGRFVTILRTGWFRQAQTR